jgi:lysophospholipase L1-like esterase
MMGKIAALLFAALAIAAGSFVAGYRYYPTRKHPSGPNIRELAIISQAAKIDRPVALMFGDSITEFAYLPLLCDGAVFNAGVGGATLADTLDLSRRVLKLIEPSKIIIAIGTNDAQTAIETPGEVFAAQYKSFLDEARAGGAEVYVANISPIAPAGQSIIDPTHVMKLNQVIEDVAKISGVPLLDLFAGMQPMNGFLPSALTVDDGIHLSPAGYDRWLRTLSKAC